MVFLFLVVVFWGVGNSGVTESLLFKKFWGGGLRGGARRLFGGGGGGQEDGIAIFSPSHLLCTIKSQMGGPMGMGLMV